MADLVPFNYGDLPIRVVRIDGEPWFVAADVCAVLDLTNVGNALARLDEPDIRTTDDSSTGQRRRVKIVNENGLYDLVLDSRKPEAKPFKRWITHEVIPQIRRTGSYGRPVLPDISTPTGVLAMAEQFAATARQLVAAQSQVAELEPLAESWQQLASAEGDYSLREAAQFLKRAGIPTGQNLLMATLREIEWLDRKGEPYQQYVNRKLLCRRPISYLHPHKGTEQLTYQIRITPKGLHELRRLLGGHGPQPLPFADGAA